MSILVISFILYVFLLKRAAVSHESSYLYVVALFQQIRKVNLKLDVATKKDQNIKFVDTGD